jgi:histidinol-phosphate aminotransferase
VEWNVAERLWMEEELSELGLDVADSQANFCWVSLGDRDEPEIVTALSRAGVAVRPGLGLGGPGHLRVTYGTRAENERFIEALRAALG